VLENRYQWCERQFDYNGLLQITEILLVRCIFELKLHQIRFLPGLRPDPDEELKQRSPWPLVGCGEGQPSHAASSPESSFPVGPRRYGVRRAHQMVNPVLIIARPNGVIAHPLRPPLTPKWEFHMPPGPGYTNSHISAMGDPIHFMFG